MIIVKKGKGCGNRPMISGTTELKGKYKKYRKPVDVELVLCALFSGDDKDKILKRFEITKQDFEDALTFAMYAVSKFDGKEDLQWDKNSEENTWV